MIDTWHDTSSRLQCSALVSSDLKFCIELLGKLTCSVGTWVGTYTWPGRGKLNVRNLEFRQSSHGLAASVVSPVEEKTRCWYAGL